MADTWLRPLPFASSCSCRPCICAWPSAVLANPLSHCTATCARQGPTDPSPTKKKKKEVEENLISSASGIAWVQSWRISRTLKEFPDLRNLPEFGICLGWAAHISRAHAAVLCFRFPPLSLQGHTLSERVNYTRKDSIPLTGCRNTKGFI